MVVKIMTIWLFAELSQSPVQNPALPPGQPGQPKIQVKGWALGDDHDYSWPGPAGAAGAPEILERNAMMVPQTVICCWRNQLCCSFSKPTRLSGLGDWRPGRARRRLGFHGWRREQTGAGIGRKTPAARRCTSAETNKYCSELYFVSMLVAQWFA